MTFNKIEGHKLRIIASDGYDVQPRLVDTIMSTSGERYDFVLEAAEIAGELLNLEEKNTIEN